MHIGNESLTTFCVDRLTEWRNDPQGLNWESAGKRVVAEFGYLGLFVVGVVETIARFIFTAALFLVYPCLNASGKQKLWSIIATAGLGSGLLTIASTAASLSMLFINPFKDDVEEKDLYICFYPCMNEKKQEK